VLLGNGDGTLQSATLYTNPVYGLGAVFAGDFDGNGTIDLLVPTNGALFLMQGNGNGTFGNPARVGPANISAGYSAVSDYTGDGIADIVTGGSSALYLLAGAGGGGFSGGLFSQPISLLSEPRAAELNGDGKADVVALDAGQGRLAIFLGGAIPDLTVTVTNPGGFTQGQSGAAYQLTVKNVGDFPTSGPVGLSHTLPAGFTATAISGDGWSCVLATLTCSRSDALAPAASYPPVTITVNIGSNITGPVSSGTSVSGGGDQASSNNNIGFNGTARLATTTTMAASPSPTQLGNQVILTATTTAGATGQIAFYDGPVHLGTRTMSGNQASLTTRMLPSGTRRLTARYLGDANYGPSTSAPWNEVVTVLATNGFSKPQNYRVRTYIQPAVADFNGDGKADVINYSDYGKLTVHMGNGDSAVTFQPPVTTTIPNCCSAFRLGDFNGDGKLARLERRWAAGFDRLWKLEWLCDCFWRQLPQLAGHLHTQQRFYCRAAGPVHR
jgi:hypothetical protein